MHRQDAQRVVSGELLVAIEPERSRFVLRLAEKAIAILAGHPR
jgi:multidrug resistance efflux pump